MHKNREEEVNHPPFTAFSQHNNQKADFMVHQPFENIYSSYSNLRRMQSSLSSQSTLQISSQTMTSKTNDSSEGSNSSSSSTIMHYLHPAAAFTMHHQRPHHLKATRRVITICRGLVEGRAFR